MTTATDRKSTEAWLSGHAGIADVNYVPKLPLDEIDLVASVALQTRDIPLDQATVERYVAALQDGAIFPDIIVRTIKGKTNDRLVILGGMHRVHAHLDAGQHTIGAFIVDCDDRTALEVAYGDNASHGLPPTEKEMVDHALVLVAKGRSAADAARIVGVDSQRITRRLALVGVEKRAAKAGVAAELTQIPTAVVPRLASLRDDRLFATVVKTIVAEGIASGPANKIIGDLNAVTSTKEALELLDVHVREHRETAGAKRAAGRPGESPYLRLRVALSAIRSLNAADLVDQVDPKELEEVARLAMDGARHLKAIHDLAQLPRTEVA